MSLFSFLKRQPINVTHPQQTFLPTAFPVRILPWVAILVLGSFWLAGCAETGIMRDQPRYSPLQASNFFADGSSARVPPAGTVPYSPDLAPDSPVLTGLDAQGKPVSGIPLMVTRDMVSKGQERFNIYCIPCHGPTAQGDGKATLFGFPKPPDLLAADAKALTAGQIFDVITNGKDKMFSYGYRVKPNERWAIISYLRAMQLKNGAVNPQELTPDELNQIGSQP